MPELRDVGFPLFILLGWLETYSLNRNHPVLREDGLLAVFLVESSFEEWRKHTPVSLDEESVSKRVDKVEEMTIPSDLEEKIA